MHRWVFLLHSPASCNLYSLATVGHETLIRTVLANINFRFKFLTIKIQVFNRWRHIYEDISLFVRSKRSPLPVYSLRKWYFMILQGYCTNKTSQEYSIRGRKTFFRRIENWIIRGKLHCSNQGAWIVFVSVEASGWFLFDDDCDSTSQH